MLWASLFALSTVGAGGGPSRPVSVDCYCLGVHCFACQAPEHVVIVVGLESKGYIDADRAGETVPTSGTSYLEQTVIGFFYLFNKRQLPFQQAVRRRFRGNSDVFFNVFILVHTGKDNLDIWIVPDPPQGPFGGASAHLSRLP